MLIGIGATVILLQLMVFIPSWLTLGTIRRVKLIASRLTIITGQILNCSEP